MSYPAHDPDTHAHEVRIATLKRERDEARAEVERLDELAADQVRRLKSERDEARAEVERLKREGSPGVMHAVDKAFYDVTVAQRDHAWAESARHKRQRDEALMEVERLRKILAENAEWREGYQ